MYPDIEIYIYKATPEGILEWLESALGTAVDQGTAKTGLQRFSVTYQDKKLPIEVFPNAVGKAWTSVWFDTPDTPWKDDIACATSAAKHLETEVRCTRGGWSESQDPDEWVKVLSTGETEEFLWKK